MIGGRPGKAKLTLTFSGCEGNGFCQKATLHTLENVEGELVVLKDNKTVVENLKIPRSAPQKFLVLESNCASGPMTYVLWGAFPGIVKEENSTHEGEPLLEFPSTPVEGYSLEWYVPGFHVTHFTDTLTQKLTAGGKLFAEV